LTHSIGRRGDAFDKTPSPRACSRRWETELCDRRTFKSRDQARPEVFVFIEGFYYPCCAHAS
jgi:hypothetical protein